MKLSEYSKNIKALIYIAYIFNDLTYHIHV